MAASSMSLSESSELARMMYQTRAGAIGIPTDVGAHAVTPGSPLARDPLPKGPHGPAPHSRVGDGSAGPALSPIASLTGSQPSVVSSPHLASRIGVKISLQEDSDCWLWKGGARGEGFG